MTEFCNQDCQLRWYELSLPAANTSILASCLEYEDSPYSLRRCDTAARVEHPWIAETYRCLTDIKRSEPDQDRLEVCTPQDTAETRVLARWLTERYATCDAGHLAPKHLASQLAWFDPDFLEVGRICARLESCEELTACIAPWEAIAMNKALP